MLVTPDVNPSACTGTFELLVVPFPNWPFALLPQHLATPDVTAQAKETPVPAPTPRLLTPDVRPETCTGTEELRFPPFPNVPSPLLPQHVTAPAVDSAHACAEPSDTLRIPEVNPETCCGTTASTFVPFPSWPEKFNPQHLTDPPCTAHDESEADIWVTPEVRPNT